MAEAENAVTTEEVQDAPVQTEIEVETEQAPAEEAASSDTSEEKDEHLEVAQSVKKRINRLTAKMREAERREQEAMQYAKSVQQEAENMRKKLEAVDHGYVNEYGNRLEIEQKSVETALKQAMADNNADAVIENQRRLAQLAVAAENYNKIRGSRIVGQEGQAPTPEQPEVRQPTQTVPAQAVPQAPPETPPDPKAQAWAEKNDWFGKDEAMTFAAFGIHQAMVSNEGFDPQSDEYYDELNTRIRKKFPQEFQKDQELEIDTSRRPVQNVASNSRGRSNGRKKKVKLNSRQVDMARRLGVSVEDYAKHVKP